MKINLYWAILYNNLNSIIFYFNFHSYFAHNQLHFVVVIFSCGKSVQLIPKDKYYINGINSFISLQSFCLANYNLSPMRGLGVGEIYFLRELA